MTFFNFNTGSRIGENVNFEKKSVDNKSMENYPACKELPFSDKGLPEIL